MKESFLLVDKGCGCPSSDKCLSFEEWMREIMEYSDATIRSRISNLKQIESIYGDLKELWKKDKLEGLLEELTYTREDSDNNVAPRHKIPIKGDLYFGSATYKSTLKLYKSYLESEAKKLNKIQQALLNAFAELKKDVSDKKKYEKGEVNKLLSEPLVKLLEKHLEEFGYEVESEKTAGSVVDTQADGKKKKQRDRYDIYCKSEKYPLIIIELDTHRADQVSKKMLSRIALNSESELIYVSLIYPNETQQNETQRKECKKYVDYINTVFSILIPPQKTYMDYWLIDPQNK